MSSVRSGVVVMYWEGEGEGEGVVVARLPTMRNLKVQLRHQLTAARSIAGEGVVVATTGPPVLLMDLRWL